MRTFGATGGFISVALSVGLPRPGVTRHRSFLESGLSSTLFLPRKSNATAVAPLRAMRVDVPNAGYDNAAVIWPSAHTGRSA
jgi:hypothetical protein